VRQEPLRPELAADSEVLTSGVVGFLQSIYVVPAIALRRCRLWIVVGRISEARVIPFVVVEQSASLAAATSPARFVQLAVDRRDGARLAEGLR